MCLILLVVIICTQTSCWDQTEVEDLAIVLGMALDKGAGDQVRVIVQVVNPKGMVGGGGGGGGGGGTGGGGQVAAYYNITRYGQTFFEAVRKMAATAPARLYFPHCQVIIISEELAREGIVEIADVLQRNTQIRGINWMLISGKGVDQHKLLAVYCPVDVVPVKRMLDIIDNRAYCPMYAVNQLGIFLELLFAGGVETHTAGIKLKPILGASKEEQKTGEIDIAKTALFSTGKMVGWLNERESRGLLWLQTGQKRGVISVNAGRHKQVVLEILQGTAQIKPVITAGGELVININIKATAGVVESADYIDLANATVLKELQNKLAQEIKKDINLALAKAQQTYNSDVFGFGAAVRRQYPQYWQQVAGQWNELYPDVETVIEVETVILRTELISRPLKAVGE